MPQAQVLLGFHAVLARIRRDSATVHEIYVDAARKDKRMQEFIRDAGEKGVRVIPVGQARLDGLATHNRHQGVVCLADAMRLATSLDDMLDQSGPAPLVLVLDGITDPHNLGACLRVADGAGVHAVLAPKDRACGLNATVAKVASGAAESVPYLTVTNLARTLRELKERDICVIGASDTASQSIFQADLRGPVALVMGAEDAGMRRLTADTCDLLVRIPMAGAVASLNVSVACAICLYEAVRQRSPGSSSRASETTSSSH